MYVPVVVGGVASVFHLAPVLPGGIEVVTAWVPDLLAPDDVHDIKFLVVLLNPFGDFLTLGVIGLFTTMLANLYFEIWARRKIG